MNDVCIYDRDEQCCGRCSNCPRCEAPEPDWDEIAELMSE